LADTDAARSGFADEVTAAGATNFEVATFALTVAAFFL
jgi:hypothetical protein